MGFNDNHALSLFLVYPIKFFYQSNLLIFDLLKFFCLRAMTAMPICSLFMFLVWWYWELLLHLGGASELHTWVNGFQV